VQVAADDANGYVRGTLFCGAASVEDIEAIEIRVYAANLVKLSSLLEDQAGEERERFPRWNF